MKKEFNVVRTFTLHRKKVTKKEYIAYLKDKRDEHKRAIKRINKALGVLQ